MDEVFRSGTLNMSASPYEGLAADPLWTDILTNRILAVAAVVLMMVHLLDLLRLLPHLLYSYSRVRGAESLEHSLGTARLRNLQLVEIVDGGKGPVLRRGVRRPRSDSWQPMYWSAVCSTRSSIPAA